ncbi:MAG: ImmA/IrrE family metallo-endopeptidase [Treponema sp.]|nr:ImmA/IrrE family metallo-endopeptidase [Treponema sp.]
MSIDENQNLIVAKPKSRRDIESLAMQVRQALHIAESLLYIDVLSILEFQLQSLFHDDIAFCVPEVWFAEEEAFYDSQKNMIFIRSDVYENAVNGNGRARFTIMHEIAHYILIKHWGAPYLLSLAVVNGLSNPSLKARDPEWQANTFAGAFLCSKNYIKQLTPKEIEIQCGVSRRAAEIAYCSSRGIPYLKCQYEFLSWLHSYSVKQEVV